ncbi:MAG: hypothetical protein ACLFV2_10220 [Desulfurivibrionaceae bacterium]
MKTVFKQDYTTQTAAWFTRFPQTEQSQKILADIRSDLADRAGSIHREVSGRAWGGMMQQVKGNNLNISV